MVKVRNNKAQALIEFVLILPILIMFLFAIIDFGSIMICKSELENKLNDAYEVAKSTIDINTLYSDIEEVVNDGTRKVKLELTFDNESDYMNIKLVSEIKTITPGLNLIIGYPYKVTTERVIKYVKQ